MYPVVCSLTELSPRNFTMAAKKSFNEWMREVDSIIDNKIGLSSADLPDQAYMDMWENGKSAKSAAAKALKSAV